MFSPRKHKSFQGKANLALLKSLNHDLKKKKNLLCVLLGLHLPGCLEDTETQGILGVVVLSSFSSPPGEKPRALLLRKEAPHLSILVALKQQEVGAVVGGLDEALRQLVKISRVCWPDLGIGCPWSHAKRLLPALLLPPPPPLQAKLRHAASQR